MSDFEDISESEEEASYRLTAKGVIAFALDGDMRATEKVWKALQEYGRKTNDYEELRGIPCVILDDHGGYFCCVKPDDS